MNHHQAGHTFLASLGKKRLRPGGRKASCFLFEEIKKNTQAKILEVACNMGTTTIELVKKYQLESIVSCDINPQVIASAKANAKKQQLENHTNFIVADAMNLPFEDASFDIIINEAMLTMISDQNRKQIISEYYRVLKPGGFLLTHDMLLRIEDDDLQKTIKNALSKAIYVHTSPLTYDGWKHFYATSNFKVVKTRSGMMSLMNPMGMFRDEGFIGTLRIFKNALRKSNRKQFGTMFKTFRKYKNELGYIAVVSRK